METARCRAFLAAADTGSFSKAAELLSYTPSGVSQLVSALEADIGYPLLRRTNKGVTVTAEGSTLIPAIREFLNCEDNIYQLAADTNGLLIGSVTIASYSSMATHWLPEIISRFQADYPQIKITLLEGIRQEVIKWLDDKRADIAFTSFREPFPYDWIPLSEDRMMAAKVGLDACFCPRIWNVKPTPTDRIPQNRMAPNAPRKPSAVTSPRSTTSPAARFSTPVTRNCQEENRRTLTSPTNRSTARMCAAQNSTPSSRNTSPSPNRGPSPPLAHRRYRPSTARPTPTHVFHEDLR